MPSLAKLSSLLPNLRILRTAEQEAYAASACLQLWLARKVDTATSLKITRMRSLRAGHNIELKNSCAHHWAQGHESSSELLGDSTENGGQPAVAIKRNGYLVCFTLFLPSPLWISAAVWHMVVMVVVLSDAHTHNTELSPIHEHQTLIHEQLIDQVDYYRLLGPSLFGLEANDV